MSSTSAASPLIDEVMALHAAWKAGRLGGEVMPEDARPPDLDADDLASYFTLGMSLNYQRDSYALWRACTSAFHDADTRWVFDINAVAAANHERLAEALVRHRVALQPKRHPQIWQRVAEGFVVHSQGSVRALFKSLEFDLGAVREFVSERRRDFPYLCGPKIANYWLYVMSSYLQWPFMNRASLSVAPDRHVIAASVRLGLIGTTEAASTNCSSLVAQRWAELLDGASLTPIEMHTPLWLWARARFSAIPDRTTADGRSDPT